MNSM